MYISNDDTICAIATPPGFGGIGVVRISGPAAREILSKIWRGKIKPPEFKTRKLYLGEITIAIHSSPFTIHKNNQVDGQILDKVMAVMMPAPNTYTGQDIAELSCHGSPVMLKRILGACVDAGARPADPGEFTRRAFLAGKMDLAQAEGVASLIHATSERGARIASCQMAGRLSREIADIADELTGLRASVEAAIDFPEEDIEFIQNEGVADKLAKIADCVGSLLATYEEGRRVCEGIRVAITGRPNVGKSSILNRLSGCERAIVHHVPGTTRDVVEETVELEGVNFKLRDTAGLRSGGCEVEGLGVERTRDEIASADLILAVFDGSKPISKEDREIIGKLEASKTIAAINKSDLPSQFDESVLEDRFTGCASISAKTGFGLDLLKQLISRAAAASEGAGDGAVITSVRHKDALGVANQKLEDADRALKSRESLECVAASLRLAHDSLSRITGEVTDDDLLEQIFSNFCIGK